MKSLENRGIVAKIVAGNCIVLTPEGNYHRVPLPSPDIKVGAEINYRRPRLASPYRTWLLVASLLVMFLGYAFIDQAMLPQAAAYVSLDLNSSLEIAVDKDLRVIAVKCFDDNAADLVEGLDLEGQGLNQALTALIDEAVAQHYIQPDQENLMVSTVSSSGDETPPIDEVALHQVIQDSMAAHGYSGQVKIYSANSEFRKAAEDQKLSPGKYLIYEQLVRSGQEVDVEEVNQQSVGQLKNNYKLELLPNYKKIKLEKNSSSKTAKIIVDEDGQGVPIEDYVKKNGSPNSAANRNDADRSESSVSRSDSDRQSAVVEPGAEISSDWVSRDEDGNNGEKIGITRKALELSKSAAVKWKKVNFNPKRFF